MGPLPSSHLLTIQICLPSAVPPTGIEGKPAPPGASGDRERLQQIRAEEADAPVTHALHLSQRGKIAGLGRVLTGELTHWEEHAQPDAGTPPRHASPLSSPRPAP